MKQITFSSENFAELIAWFKAGEVAVLPTDTIPGFAADAANQVALEKIALLKQREVAKPFLLLVPDFVAAEKLCEFNDVARRLVKAFWPGPMTLLLPRKHGMLPHFFPHEPKFALRIPDNKLLLKFLFTYGKPLVSTSINLAGESALIQNVDIAAHLQDQQILVATSTEQNPPYPSTIINVEYDKIAIVREGSISKNDIQKVQDNFFNA